MSSSLCADEYRRLLKILEACERALSLESFLNVTLDALDEHLGHHGSAFMLALGHPGQPGTRAYAGANHGFPEYVLEEYFERWADSDPLASDPGRRRYMAHSTSSIAEVYQSVDTAHRRFVDDFLRRARSRAQLSVWLDPGTTTHGYVTLMGDTDYSERERAQLMALRPHLTNLLRAHLPRGVMAAAPPGLSAREAEVCELVALGWSNRQIADVLHVEEDTVKKHVSHSLAKLSLERRTQLAVAWAQGSGAPVTAVRD